MKYIFKNTKSLTGGLIENFRKITASLITVASLEPKQKGAQSPFYATATNSLVGCAFWGSDE